MKTSEKDGNQTNADELVKLKAEEAEVFQLIRDRQRDRQSIDREIEKLLGRSSRVRRSIMKEERARKS